jgi:integrase
MGSDDRVRLGDYLDEWLERRRNDLRPSTLAGYRQAARCYLRPHLGQHRLDELDRRTIERLYAHLLARGGLHDKPLSPGTVRLAHVVLRRSLQDAVLDGLIDENPAAMARTPKHDPYETELDDDLRVWTAEQAVRFLADVDDHPMRAIWHVALGTGARRGEILGLRWRDVELDAAQIRIRRSLTVVDGITRLLGTKTSRNRTLSIGPSVVDALRREQQRQRRHRKTAASWDDKWDLVFTTETGAPVDPMDVTVEFRRLVREADVPVIRLHDTRHTHASLLLQQGVPMKVVSERLGHAKISMTMDVYAHLLPAMDEDAAARLEAAFHRAAG